LRLRGLWCVLQKKIRAGFWFATPKFADDLGPFSKSM
jgi:hypothetical protein